MTDQDWGGFCQFADRHFGMSHNSHPDFNRHWFCCRGVAPEQEKLLDGWSGLVLEDQGRLVGIMMFIIVTGSLDGNAYPMAWISTGVVEEEARAIGGGAQMYLWIYQNFPLVGALSGNELSRPINELLGRGIPGVSMRRHVMLHDPSAESLYPAGDDTNVTALVCRVEAPAGLKTAWLSEPPDDFDSLWDTVREKIVLTTSRSAAHYQWRILDAPFMDYRLLEMRAEGQLVGLAAVRFQHTPFGNACRIIDFVANPDQAVACWQAVAAVNAGEGALFSDFHVIGSFYDEALSAAGFTQQETEPQLSGLPNLLSPVDHRKWTNTFHIGGSAAKTTDDWRRPNAVYFTKADSDRDWPTHHELDRLGITTKGN